MKIYFLLFLILLGIFFGCQNTRNERSVSELTFDSLLIVQKESWSIPGVAIGILRNDSIVYAKGLGVKSIKTGDAITTKSIFHTASVSKPFTATAIVQLLEQGKLNLNDKLIQYIPYFKMEDTRYRDITLKHILTHTSGIPDVDDYEWSQPQYDEDAAKRYASGFSETILDFEPGTEYNYSNAAYDLLANVISSVSGMTFEAYMKKFIFEPVGMTSSTFYTPEVPEDLATTPHILDDSLQIATGYHYPYNRRHAPSSTLQSNVEDMLKWARVNLNKGEIDGKRIYSEDSYHLLISSQVETQWGANRALGWGIREVGKYKVINHSGGDDGYLSFFAFVPEKNLGFVMMANNDFYWSGDASRIWMQQLLLGEVEKEWKVSIGYKLKDYILTEGIEKCKEVYFQIAKEDSIYWCEPKFLDELGYSLLWRGHEKAALDIFQFAVELEPDNATWNESVGEAYLALGEKENAIEWYEKAVELNPKQEYSKAKLMELVTKERR
ncbi:MAG: serine hydrolase [Bacteroidota bacterium]